MITKLFETFWIQAHAMYANGGTGFQSCGSFLTPQNPYINMTVVAQCWPKHLNR